jgi:hypothetical protein
MWQQEVAAYQLLPPHPNFVQLLGIVVTQKQGGTIAGVVMELGGTSVHRLMNVIE